MTVRVGVNGFGRIGRNFWRAVEAQNAAGTRGHRGGGRQRHHRQRDAGASVEVRLDPGPVAVEVSATDEDIVVDGKAFKGLAIRDPATLPWKDLGVDVVIESTGLFTKRDAAAKHLEAGAKKVIISAPATGEDVTMVMGVNDDAYDGTQDVISNASCTTNCLGPLAKVLDDLAGIEQGLMTTIHAYTQDQNLQDGPHNDLRRARAAALNVVPTSDGGGEGDRVGVAASAGEVGWVCVAGAGADGVGDGFDVFGAERGVGGRDDRRRIGRRRPRGR